MVVLRLQVDRLHDHAWRVYCSGLSSELQPLLPSERGRPVLQSPWRHRSETFGCWVEWSTLENRKSQVSNHPDLKTWKSPPPHLHANLTRIRIFSSSVICKDFFCRLFALSCVYQRDTSQILQQSFYIWCFALFNFICILVFRSICDVTKEDNNFSSHILQSWPSWNRVVKIKSEEV